MDSLCLKSENVLHNLGVKCADIKNDNFKNLIHCVENWFFVFNAEDNSIVVTNLSQTPYVYQTLVPSISLPFQVNSFKVNPTLTYCVYFGNSGLAVIELPNTCGIGGNFAFGKETIICRCQILDERYFVCHPSLNIIQVKWLPHASGDEMLLVLTSKNEIRLYSAATGSLQSFYRIDNSALTLSSLGHMGVDFDFLPPNYNSDTDTLEFPMLVLFMDADVHLVNLFVSDNNLLFSPHNYGSLPFVPQSEDNYGEDASSILVIPTSPPMIAIATSSGTLYHCLLFENEQDEETWSGIGSVAQKPYNLHVVEVVELKLGVGSEEDETKMFYNPVHLQADIAIMSRYFCFHKSGVHIVKIPLVEELTTLAEVEDNDDWHTLLPQFSSSHCRIEHLIFIGTTEERPDLLGFSISLLPRCVILLLGNGEYVSVTLSSNVALEDVLQHDFEVKLNIDEKKTTDSYSSYIGTLLRMSENIPLLKVDFNSSFTDEEVREIYMKNMEILLRQVLPHLETVSQNMILKVDSLKQLENDLLCKLKDYGKIEQECKDTAERLADKYEEINERHEQLMMRSQRVLMNVYTKCNTDPVEEQIFKKKLDSYKSRIDGLHNQLYEIRNVEEQARVMNDRELQSPGSLHLNSSKEKALNGVLNEIQLAIQDIKGKVMEAAEDVNYLMKGKA